MAKRKNNNSGEKVCIMITIVIKGNKAHSSPEFLLKDLPGSGGRMDVMCRCLTSSLLLSHDIRTDVEVILCLEGPPTPPRTIRVRGDKVRYLSPDERSTAILLQKALRAYEPEEEVESTPGIYVSDASFKDIVEENMGRLVVLDEKGDDMASCTLPSDPCFVLGDHIGFEPEEDELLHDAPLRVSVSPRVLHASHCIVLLLNRIDKDVNGQSFL